MTIPHVIILKSNFIKLFLNNNNKIRLKFTTFID